MEFSAAMKSSRHWALRCSSRAGASCSSVTPGGLGQLDGVQHVDQRRAAALQELRGCGPGWSRRGI